MKRLILLILLPCLLLPVLLHAQGDFYLKVYAGSNAPWGESQYLTVDARGPTHYKLIDAEKGPLDSMSFTISKDDLNKLKQVFTTIRFVQLNKSYNEQSIDGTALSATLTSSGKTHRVTWFNIHTKESDQLKDRLNGILKKKGISLLY